MSFGSATVAFQSTGFTQLKNQFDQLRQGLVNLAGPTNQLNSSLNNIAATLKTTFSSVSTSIQNSMKQASASINTTAQQLQAFKASSNLNIAVGGGGGGAAAGGLFSQAGVSLAHALRDAFVVLMSTFTALVPLKKAAEFEMLELSMKTLTGSIERTKIIYADLVRFAAETPFTFPEVAEMSRKFELFGGAALNTKENLRIVGDAAAASGREIELVSFWVARLYAMLHDNQAFGEQAIHLQKLGVMTGAVREKMVSMQKSGIDGQQIFDFYLQSLKRFSGGMEEASMTMVGLTATLKDYFILTIAKIGQIINDDVRPKIQWLIDTFRDLYDNMSVGTAQTIAVAAEILGLVGAFNALRVAVNLFRAVFGTAFFSMMSFIVKGLGSQVLLLVKAFQDLRLAIGVLSFTGFINTTAGAAAVVELLNTNLTVLVGLLGRLGIILGGVAVLGKVLADLFEFQALAPDMDAFKKLEITLKRIEEMKKNIADKNEPKAGPTLMKRAEENNDIKEQIALINMLRNAVIQSTNAKEQQNKAIDEGRRAQVNLKQAEQDMKSWLPSKFLPAMATSAAAAIGGVFGTGPLAYIDKAREFKDIKIVDPMMLRKWIIGEQFHLDIMKLIEALKLKASDIAANPLKEIGLDKQFDNFKNKLTDLSLQGMLNMMIQRPDLKWEQMKFDKEGKPKTAEFIKENMEILNKAREKEAEALRKLQNEEEIRLEQLRQEKEAIATHTLENLGLEAARRNASWSPMKGDAWTFWSHSLESSLGKKDDSTVTVKDIAKEQLTTAKAQLKELEKLGLTADNSKKVLELGLSIDALKKVAAP